MRYFIEGFRGDRVRDVMTWIREDHDPRDQWGWVMSWLFDIAGELDRRGDDVPACLGYRAGASGPYVSEDRAAGLAECAAETLTIIARGLNRFADALRAAGENY